jgi:hypothetical protein
MNYLKINGIDFSKYVNALKINKNNIYNAQTNAAGDTVVDYINSKRQIEVGIIPLDAAIMVALQTIINGFSVTLSFLNPNTGELENNVKCILPASEIEYYTIQANNTSFKAFTLTFIEL